MNTKPILGLIKRKEPPAPLLPPVGTEFAVNGKRYRVVFVNSGRTRFTSRPVIDGKNESDTARWREP